MIRKLFIAIILWSAWGIYSHAHAGVVDEPGTPKQSTRDLRARLVENTCIELGKSAKRGLKSRDTELFEGLGCCYNDGLKEPLGC